jgi:hypothetical protein
VRELREIPHVLEVKLHGGEQILGGFSEGYRVVEERELSIPSNVHYNYYRATSEMVGEKTNNLSVILITVYKTHVSSSFEKKNIFIICTQNETVLM